MIFNNKYLEFLIMLMFVTMFLLLNIDCASHYKQIKSDIPESAIFNVKCIKVSGRNKSTVVIEADTVKIIIDKIGIMTIFSSHIYMDYSKDNIKTF